jgi:hypothetical protein
VEDNVSAALGVLHSLGLVHCDVQAGNILRIDGVWKLGDLGGVTPKGRPMRAIQKDRRYVPEGVALGSPADPENDMFSLRHLVGRMR